MKKIILSIAAVIAIGVSAFANFESPVANPRAQEVFKKEFAGAEAVTWAEEGGYNKVSFLLGGNRAIALFSNEGELLGSIRDLVYYQLPLAVITTIDKRFTGSAIFDIREVSNSEGTRYQFTLEQKGKKYHVALFPDGNLASMSKIKK